jgi:DNA mismatch repair protein MutS
MEDPAAAKARGAKGPLQRAVVRLVTPGTLTEDALLEGARANFCAAVVELGGRLGVAWLDISTGIFETEVCGPAGLAAMLGRVAPAEIVADVAIELGVFAPRRVATDRLALQLPAGAAAGRRAACWAR